MPNLVTSFDIYKKTDLTSRDELHSNESNISWVIGSSWFTQVSDGWKPDWLGFNSSSPIESCKLY